MFRQLLCPRVGSFHVPPAWVSTCQFASCSGSLCYHVWYRFMFRQLVFPREGSLHVPPACVFTCGFVHVPLACVSTWGIASCSPNLCIHVWDRFMFCQLVYPRVGSLHVPPACVSTCGISWYLECAAITSCTWTRQSCSCRLLCLYADLWNIRCFSHGFRGRMGELISSRCQPTGRSRTYHFYSK